MLGFTEERLEERRGSSSSLKDWSSAYSHPGITVGRTPGDKISFPELRDRVAPIGLHRLQVRPIHYTAQINIVAEVAGSDRLASVGLKLLLIRSVNDAIAVHIGR